MFADCFGGRGGRGGTDWDEMGWDGFGRDGG